MPSTTASGAACTTPAATNTRTKSPVRNSMVFSLSMVSAREDTCGKARRMHWRDGIIDYFTTLCQIAHAAAISTRRHRTANSKGVGGQEDLPRDRRIGQAEVLLPVDVS